MPDQHCVAFISGLSAFMYSVVSFFPPVFWHRFVYKLGWILDHIKKLQQKQKRWIIISTESLGFITDERNVDKILVIKIYSHEIQYELWA